MRLQSAFSIAAVLLASVCASIGVAAENPNGETVIPEFFVTQQFDYCVFRVDVKDPSRANREREFLQFLDRSFEGTLHWNSQFMVGAIDYEDFTYFHVLSYWKCDQNLVNNLVLNFFEQSKVACGKECASSQTILTREPASPLVMVFGPDNSSYRTPIPIFEHYRSRKELENCVIKVPVHPTGNATLLGSETYRVFNVVKYKYKMVFDSFVKGNDLYVLFPRECKYKRQLFDLLKRFFDRESAGSSGALGQPDLSPDIGDYHFSQTGRD